jgi:hypothetical protein
MKKFIVTAILFHFFLFVYSQEKTIRPYVNLKWAPAGLYLGNLSLQGEYNFGKNSLTAKIGIPLNHQHTFSYDGKDALFDMKATCFQTGYRHYLSKKKMQGAYVEPYFKYLHHISEGYGDAVLDGEKVRMNFTNDFNSVGVGVQMGVQFLISRKIVIDFYFFGPEINSATNNFKAVEVSNVAPWNSTDAYQAEQDVRAFIQKFPFIRHNMDVMVDSDNKTVRADFKGPLPGYRIGLSFGFAF